MKADCHRCVTPELCHNPAPQKANSNSRLRSARCTFSTVETKISTRNKQQIGSNASFIIKLTLIFPNLLTSQ